MGIEARYASSFYDEVGAPSARSAEVVAPLVAALVEPASVIDVGCGTGGWLKAFADVGASEVLGLDGGDVRADQLEIAPASWRRVDLMAPLKIDRTFDLAVSLEVAEHLPAARAAGFVAELTSLSDAVLFSAAIPGQGGVHHVNEQWPSFWAAEFATNGFVPCDAIRPAVWNNDDVVAHYAQNVVLYFRDGSAALERARSLVPDHRFGVPVDLVHPRFFSTRMSRRYRDLSLRRWLKLLPEILRGRARR